MSLGGGRQFLFLKRQEVGDRLTHTVHDKATSKKMYLKHIQYVEFFFFLKKLLIIIPTHKHIYSLSFVENTFHKGATVQRKECTLN